MIMDVSVMSCKRDKNYIYNLIESFTSSSKNILNVFIDGHPNDYLDNFHIKDCLKVNKMSFEECELSNSSHVFTRMANNYKRCLNQNLHQNGVLIVEDDVVFANNWEFHFDRCIESLKKLHNDNFIFSLFTSRNINLKENQFYHESRRDFGGVAIYYPEPIRKLFLKYIIDFEGNLAHNLILSKFMLENSSIPTYVAVPCFVQHCGIKSTWENTKYMMKAIKFEKDLN